ncbi:hypothetical protein CYLTODRAFT_248378 [Cylindrobasidium torrendii FP15055 ss-10]|uniref:Uncharacterized protein n=1 Tax=Cylindrobasidium torrendii FP15055 ss-10 TaxID=1314674 RepID=A0A0D7ATC1_9AGAR|nr:hypothetical protein CYLTODRAFT_248378 [Cylindrobasidium torrendii FP15055 ss-10]
MSKVAAGPRIPVFATSPWGFLSPPPASTTALETRLVHSAIVEGALQIVDEKRKRAGMPSGEFDGSGVEHGMNLSSKSSDPTPKESSSSGQGGREGSVGHQKIEKP